MIKVIQDKMKELTDMLSQISDKEYSQSHQELSEATIGQHTRHIIELFQCLDNQYEQSNICYDNRKRDIEIQTNTSIAKKCLEKLSETLHKSDKRLSITHQLEEELHAFESSYHRELMYNLEHCIHHQALIKVALKKTDYNIPETFGVAPSTLRHRTK